MRSKLRSRSCARPRRARRRRRRRLRSPPPIPRLGEVGVASRFFAVGSVVPFAEAGAGAVATQAFANTSHGARGLALLRAGVLPERIAHVLTRGDKDSARRQVGIVAA